MDILAVIVSKESNTKATKSREAQAVMVAYTIPCVSVKLTRVSELPKPSSKVDMALIEEIDVRCCIDTLKQK